MGCRSCDNSSTTFMDAPNVNRFDTFPVYQVIKAGLELPIRANVVRPEEPG